MFVNTVYLQAVCPSGDLIEVMFLHPLWKRCREWQKRGYNTPCPVDCADCEMCQEKLDRPCTGEIRAFAATVASVPRSILQANPDEDSEE